MRRSSVVLLLVVALAAALTEPASAQVHFGGGDPQVVFTGAVEVAEGESAENVVIFNGPATIRGNVAESVVAFNGDVTVSGTVGENVVSFNGDVLLESGARVNGDVVSRRPPVIREGATVQGVIRRARPGEFREFGFLGRVAFWLAVSFSVLLLGVLLLLLAGRRAPDGIWDAVRRRTGASIGWGLLLFFGIPILAVITLFTLVGIPFGVMLLLGLLLIYWIGYATSAWLLGRALVRPPRNRFLAFLAGWAILRLLALIPIAGAILWFAGAVFGLGALFAAARAGARRDRTEWADYEAAPGATPLPG